MLFKKTHPWGNMCWTECSLSMSTRWGHPPADCGCFQMQEKRQEKSPLHICTATHAAQLSVFVSPLCGLVEVCHASLETWGLGHDVISKGQCVLISKEHEEPFYTSLLPAPHRLKCCTHNSTKIDFEIYFYDVPSLSGCPGMITSPYALSCFSLSPFMVLKLYHSSTVDYFSYTKAICQRLHFLKIKHFYVILLSVYSYF